MPLTKIFRVTCKTKYEHIQNLHYGFLEDTTDFINRFPISREIDECIKKHKLECDKIINILYNIISTETTITEFLKYEQ